MLHYNALPAAAKIDTWRLYKTPSALAFPSAKKNQKTTNSSPFFVYLKISHIHGLPNTYILQGTSLIAKCFINFYSKQVPIFSFLIVSQRSLHIRNMRARVSCRFIGGYSHLTSHSIPALSRPRRHYQRLQQDYLARAHVGAGFPHCPRVHACIRLVTPSRPACPTP